MATIRIIEGRARFADLALTYAVGVTAMMFRTRLSAAVGTVAAFLTIIAAGPAGLSATAAITFALLGIALVWLASTLGEGAVHAWRRARCALPLIVISRDGHATAALMAERHDTGDRPGWYVTSLVAFPAGRGLAKTATAAFLDHVEGTIWLRARTKKLAAKYAESGFVPDADPRWMVGRYPPRHN